MIHSMAQKDWTSSKDESREMMALWPDIVRDLTEAGRHLDIPDATKWMAKVCHYIFYIFLKYSANYFSGVAIQRTRW